MGGFLDVTTPLPETRQNCPHIARSPSPIEDRGDRVVGRRVVVVVQSYLEAICGGDGDGGGGGGDPNEGANAHSLDYRK